MANYIKDPHTAIFTGFAACGKSRCTLDLMEKEHSKHCDYIIICSTLRWNKADDTKSYIRHDDKQCLA